MMASFLRMNTASSSSSGTLLGNTVANPKSDLKAITARSGVSYDGPLISPPVVENALKATMDTVIPTNNGNTENVQPQVVSSKPPVSTSEPANTPEKANDQIEKFYQLFKDMSFEISFTDALILMPKFASTLKALISNKEKLSEMSRTLLNEHCYAVLLKKLPEKLGDPGKFLIPCDFSGMAECLTLADLGASINLMPYSMWKKLSLLDLTPTCMILELADRSISRPVGVAKDVYVKVGSFHFLADFVVVDFDADPRVPLILGRSFLKTERALIDVFEGELTLRVGKEAITFNLDQISMYFANYNDMTAKRIDVIDMAYEEYSQEVLGFSDVTASGNPTPIVSTTSPTQTPFGDSDFLLFEEANAFLAILNSDPAPSLPNHEQSVPSFTNELKACEAETIKSFVDEPPEVELKDLPPHLEYAFLEGDNKLPVIIAKELGEEEKAALIKNRGNNFQQGSVYQPPVFQSPAYQAPAYQAPAPQTHGVSKEDFSAYVKANDAVMRNVQTQSQNMQNQLTNLTDLMTKFMNANTASTSNLGTLPSNTIANPRSDLKAITTRSGVSYDGPQI
nr:reverse transcriptase domain-containing protein [Tanacetum cinerariifolium]